MSKSYSKKARGIFISAQAVEGVPAPLGTATVTGTLSGNAIGAFTALVTLTGTAEGTGILKGVAATTTYTGTISGLFSGVLTDTGTVTAGVSITGETSGVGSITAGTAIVVSLSGVTQTDVIACFEPTYDTEISSETLEFAGDEFSRDIRTDITDRVLGSTFTTLVPALGVPTAAPGIADFPLETLFESTGATVTYFGADSTSKVKVSNDVVSTNQVTITVAAVSADDPTLQKVYRGFDGNTTVDLEMEIDKRAKLKWSPKAIPVDDAAVSGEFPKEIAKITPIYGNQKDLNLPTLSAKNITQAQLEVFRSLKYTGSTLGAIGSGTANLPIPFTGTVKNLCFSKLMAANLFGFTWERLHNSCQTGFEKLVATPDVVITILEDDLSATLIPDRNVTDGGMLEGYFAFALEYGKVAGKIFYLSFDKLQCVNVKNTEIGSRSAKEITFKNCSHATLRWSAVA